MSTVVYGASDDLIEVDGDVREEFYALDEEGGKVLAFSTGVVLRVTYANSGVWRIVPVFVPDDASVRIEHAPEDDEDNYSDRATVEGDVLWVVCGKDVCVAKNVRSRARVGEGDSQ